MKIKVTKSDIHGEIAVPGSKSHTIRAIAAALMADGKSIVRAPLESADTRSTLEAAKLFGAQAQEFADRWEITGTGGKLAIPTSKIDMGNSGTGLRILTGLAATSSGKITFDGDESLRSRPMGQLLDALEMLGVKVEANAGKCPVSLTGPIPGGATRVNGQSSQFLTSLLFACPYAKSDTEISVYNLNEKPYVEITLGWLERLGVELEYSKDLTSFKIKGNQQFKPFDMVIPADFSTSAFPLGAAVLAGQNLKIRNLDFSDLQGDKAVFDYLEQMGADIDRQQDFTSVSRSALKGVDIDLNATPDALPLMSVVAAFAEGTTRLLNVPQARIKETDRIDCMTRELRKMGVQIEELEDGMVIQGGKPHGAEVEGYGDHRIVMALAVAGLAAKGETVINGAEAAAVTYPDFIKDFKKIGANIEEM
jgi:3-phosphoshikimate 1-carboxyvinyltransferase